MKLPILYIMFKIIMIVTIVIRITVMKIPILYIMFKIIMIVTQ